MSLFTVNVGCTIFSKRIHSFGKIVKISDNDFCLPTLILEYDNMYAFESDISKFEEYVLDGTIIQYNKELTEEERLVELLKLK